MRDPRSVLYRPLMTEKSMRQKEEQNSVTFQVAKDANKVEIRQAVERVFNVKVADVRTTPSRASGSGWAASRASAPTGRRPS